MSNSKPIGIFDSGIGGLTVANAIQKYLPEEQIIYFGDTAHLPYGDKAASSIIEYSKTIAAFLLEHDVKIIVIACNTASSLAFEQVKRVAGNVPVINVIDPVVSAVAQNGQSKNVGVIGTRATILSGEYEKRIVASNAEISVKSLATPLLVPMIEEHIMDDEVGKLVIDKYLSQEHLANIDSLILGCTHYPLIRDLVETQYDGSVKVIDSADIVGKYVLEYLTQNNMKSDHLSGDHHFYVSDYTDSFEMNTRSFFTESIHLEEKNIWSTLKPGAV